MENEKVVIEPKLKIKNKMQRILKMKGGTLWEE
jgi:hypothetical protein